MSNDFYAFDPVNLQWHIIDRYAGQAPTRRAGHVFEADKDTNKLYLFGGRGNTGTATTSIPLNDVWEYDVFSRKWVCSSCQGYESHLTRGGMER